MFMSLSLIYGVYDLRSDPMTQKSLRFCTMHKTPHVRARMHAYTHSCAQHTYTHARARMLAAQAPAGRAGLDRAKGPFKECIVFMIGAGSYAERESLVGWASRSGAPSVAGVCACGLRRCVCLRVPMHVKSFVWVCGSARTCVCVLERG